MGRSFLQAIVLLVCLFSTQTKTMKEIIVEKTTEFTNHTDEVRGIVPFDDERVLSFSKEKFLQWNAQQKEGAIVLQGIESNTFGDVQKFDKEKILSISQTGVIKLWDMKEHCYHTFEKKEQYAYAENVNKLDDKTVFVHDFGLFGLWDVTTQNYTKTVVKKHAHGIGRSSKKSFCKINKNKILSLRLSKIYLWDVAQRKKVLTFLGYKDDGHYNTISNLHRINEDCFVSTDLDYIIKLWSIAGNKCMQTFSGHQNLVENIINIDEEKLISSSKTEIVTWEKNSGEGWYLFQTNDNRVQTIEKIDDRTIVSGHKDGTIKIWDVEDNYCLKTIPAHKKRIQNLAVLGKTILSSCRNGKKIKLHHLSKFH